MNTYIYIYVFVCMYIYGIYIFMYVYLVYLLPFVAEASVFLSQWPQPTDKKGKPSCVTYPYSNLLMYHISPDRLKKCDFLSWPADIDCSYYLFEFRFSSFASSKIRSDWEFQLIIQCAKHRMVRRSENADYINFNVVSFYSQNTVFFRNALVFYLRRNESFR
jgi:hypothetical protein